MSEFTHQAAPINQKHVPSFIVKKIEEKRKHTTYFLDEDRKLTPKEVLVDGGYIVAFPMKGHSIRVKDEVELKRLGFDQMIPLLNADQEDADDPISFLPNSVSASTKGK